MPVLYLPYSRVPVKFGISKWLIIVFLFLNLCSQISAQHNSSIVVIAEKKTPDLKERFQCFYPLISEAEYFIELCADVPDNGDPDRVYVKNETGHVFIILGKILPDTKDTIAQVFGFYPRRPASSLIFKNVRSEILDNGNRIYDASIRKLISAEDLRVIISKALELTELKYNLNKFNCYDYAVAVYNATPGVRKLPFVHIRFPFIAGKGGSPVGLYRQLLNLKNSNEYISEKISIGLYKSPTSSKINLNH